MRGYLAQSYNMNDVGVQPADFVVEPDVTAFDLSELERADEMTAVGERVNRRITRSDQSIVEQPGSSVVQLI